MTLNEIEAFSSDDEMLVLLLCAHRAIAIEHIQYRRRFHRPFNSTAVAAALVEDDFQRRG